VNVGFYATGDIMCPLNIDNNVGYISYSWSDEE
jgi:hypothetical protein